MVNPLVNLAILSPHTMSHSMRSCRCSLGTSYPSFIFPSEASVSTRWPQNGTGSWPTNRRGRHTAETWLSPIPRRQDFISAPMHQSTMTTHWSCRSGSGLQRDIGSSPWPRQITKFRACCQPLPRRTTSCWDSHACYWTWNIFNTDCTYFNGTISHVWR